MEKPRDVFLAGCRAIGASLDAVGFQPRADGQELRRQRGSFVEKLWFQSSHSNVAGQRVAIWPGASVHSKALKAWRDKWSETANWGDYVASSRVENIAGTPYGVWDLAQPARRPAVLAAIRQAIEHSVLPWYDLIEDGERLMRRAVAEDIPGMGIAHLTEYAVFRGRPDVAVAILQGWLARNPEFANATSDAGLTRIVERHGLRVKLPDFSTNAAKVEAVADRLRAVAGGPLTFK